MTNPLPHFSVIVPCYNERGAISDTVKGLKAIFDLKVKWELFVINDGSDDGTTEILDELVQDIPELRVIHHDGNRGYGAAIKSGIRRASAELIVITDADGTYPNHRIPDLLELMDDADMVVGARTGASVKYPIMRKIPKALLVRYCRWITGRKIPDMNSGLRVFRKSIALEFLHVLPNSFSFTTTITLAALTNDYFVRYVPIDYAARIGKSKIKPVGDTIRFLQLILRTGMYFAPIRAFAPIVIALAVAFLICAGYDIFINENLTDKTLIFLMLTLNTGFFALIADVIDKRSGR